MPNVMRLVVLAVTATVGCSESSHSSTGWGASSITFYWSFIGGQYQTYGDGTRAWSGCAEAGVDTVVIAVDDPSGRRVLDGAFACENDSMGTPGIGIEITPVFNGTYAFAVEAWRGQTPAYAAQGEALLAIGADTPVEVALDALYGDVNIDYFVDCIGIDRIAVAVYESDAFGSQGTNLVYSTDLGPNPVIFVPCGNRLTIPSLYSPMYYELQFVSALDEYGYAVRQLCNQVIDHTATATQQSDTFIFGSLQSVAFQCP